MAVQWLGLRTFTAEGAGLICGRGTKIPKPHRAAKTNKTNKNPQNKKHQTTHISLDKKRPTGYYYSLKYS